MTLLPTPLEEAAKKLDPDAFAVDEFGSYALVSGSSRRASARTHATAAITAYLAQAGKEGWVMVPGEITEAMRWATWIDQSRHVGANEQEARVLAGRRMIDNPEQKTMDESAYRAMLAAAQNGGE